MKLSIGQRTRSGELSSFLALVAAAALVASSTCLLADPGDGEPAASRQELTTTRLSTAPGREKKPALQVSVDGRVELMSIIFALAGNPEYTQGRVKSYVRDAEKHFVPFKDHAVVQLTRKLRAKRGVSFDAPMSLAVHLTDAFNLKEKVPFRPRPPGLDGRWRLAEVRAFLREARRFAEQAKFRKFFETHRGLYDQAAGRLKATMARHGHLEWFDRFFGKRPGANFSIFLGMLNGPNCYGASLRTGRKLEMYCVLGVWRCDKRGIPEFPKSVLPTVVHEFSHSYVNPLADRHSADFKKAGKRIFERVKDIMKRQAYAHWHTVVKESIVRACVVRYRLANEGALAAMGETWKQHRLGFVWTGELSRLLAEYETQRDKYPTFEAFMPRIVKFFNEYADRAPASRPKRPQPPAAGRQAGIGG